MAFVFSTVLTCLKVLMTYRRAVAEISPERFIKSYNSQTDQFGLQHSTVMTGVVSQPSQTITNASEP